MAIDLQQAQAMLDAYTGAELAILTGNQSYVFQGRQVKRADLDMIQAGRREWEQKVKEIERGGGGIVIQFPDKA